MRLWTPPSSAASGQRLGGFIGTPSAQVQLTTVNEIQDIPAAVLSFTKGERPIRCMVQVNGPMNTLTTRWPYIEVWDADANALVWSQQIPIYVASAAIPTSFWFEPNPQPSVGVKNWKLRFKHSPNPTPGTATLLATAGIQFLVYNG